MSSTQFNFSEWINSLPSEGGFRLISKARSFAHEESQYDTQYALDPANLQVGRGLVSLVEESGGDFSGPAMEVGCGTGLLSLGLVAAERYPNSLITDPSPSFLRITQKKVQAQKLNESRVCYAVLAGEELERLPADAFSLVVLRSTLHHILHVEAFIRAAARVLRPGGILTFQEPCMEGYVLMGALVQFLPNLVKAAGKKLSSDQQKKVNEFVATMCYYARRDVDKTLAEDKHLFRVDELMKMAASCGMSTEFRPNMVYEHFSVPPAARPKPDTFTPFLRAYAQYCMSWDKSLLEVLDKYLLPFGQFVQDASGGGSGPYMHGVFVCRKS